MAILRTQADGGGAINFTRTAESFEEVVSVELHLSAAPTTSENLTITRDNSQGPEYDTRLYTLDMSSASTTDLLWTPDQPMYLWPGDAVDVAYANTDGRTYGLTVTVKGA